MSHHHPPAAGHHHDPKRGIILKLVSVLCFAVMSVSVKLLSHTYPVGELLFARSFFAIFPLLPLFFLAGGFRLLHTKRLPTHISRSLIGLTAMGCTFYALPRLPLATMTAFQFTMPLFGALLGIFWLKEKANRLRIIAILTGFVGVLMVLRPPNGADTLAAGIALLAAFLVAIIGILIRQLTATEPGLRVVSYFTIITSALSALMLPFDFIMPSGQDAALLVASGLFGGLGQVLMTQSFRYAPVSVLVIFEYTGLLWASLFGYLFWSDLPVPIEIAGALLICAAGVIVLKSESAAAKTPALQVAGEPH